MSLAFGCYGFCTQFARNANSEWTKRQQSQYADKAM